MGRSYYQLVIRHDALHKQRTLRGDNRYLVEEAGRVQMAAWNEQYARKQETAKRRQERDSRKRELEENLREAELRTADAQGEIQALRALLTQAARTNPRIDWKRLKQNQAFTLAQPTPRQPQPLPVEPTASDASYQPQLSLLDKFWQSSAEKKRQAAAALFAADHAAWEKRASNAEAANAQSEAQNAQDFEAWRRKSDEFHKAQHAHNESVDLLEKAYRSGKPDAIIDYCELVLSASTYPDCCPKSFDLDFRPAAKTVIVDYDLPAPEELPRLEEVKYMRTKGEFSEVEMTRKEADKQYSDVLCQIALRTIHELFGADAIGTIDVTVFNGRVTANDPGTGHEVTRCVLSVRATKPEFARINIERIDALMCVQSLGGVAGGNLAQLKAVQPLAEIDQNEGRFGSAEELTQPDAGPIDDWKQLTRQLTTPAEMGFVPIVALAKLVGLGVMDQYSAAHSRQLVGAILERGFAIEPDAIHGGVPYRPADQVGLFRPLGHGVTAAYASASTLFQLGVMMADVDEQPTEEELQVTREYVQRSVRLNGEEQQRLLMLEKVLYRQPDLAGRNLAQLGKRLAQGERERIVELMVCVAGADGEISALEIRSLERVCRTLDLPIAILEKIMRKLGATVDEVTIQDKGPGRLGEKIPRRSAENSVPKLKLDMRQVEKITHETTELAGMLAAVMNEGGASPSVRRAAPAAVSTPTAAPTSPSRAGDPVARLDEKYRPLLKYVMKFATLSKAQFAQACRELQVRPMGAFDALNEWSDEHLGDFLLEGEEPITVHRNILPNTP